MVAERQRSGDINVEAILHVQGTQLWYFGHLVRMTPWGGSFRHVQLKGDIKADPGNAGGITSAI